MSHRCVASAYWKEARRHARKQGGEGNPQPIGLGKPRPRELPGMFAVAAYQHCSRHLLYLWRCWRPCGRHRPTSKGRTMAAERSAATPLLKPTEPAHTQPLQPLALPCWTVGTTRPTAYSCRGSAICNERWPPRRLNLLNIHTPPLLDH